MKYYSCICKKLESELHFLSVEQLKDKIKTYSIVNIDPFVLTRHCMCVVLRDAQEELSYLGCYLSCKQNDMSYMYKGLFQGNRLKVAHDAGLGNGADHGSFFAEAVIAFACNDYKLVEKILPINIGFSKNSRWKVMTNLLMAIFYRNDQMKQRAAIEAEKYLQKKHPGYEVLICEYLLAVLCKDFKNAGKYLQEICENYVKYPAILEASIIDTTKIELSKAICLFGHGLFGIAAYYMPEEIIAKLPLPNTNTFIQEYEYYRRKCKNTSHDCLIQFEGENDFLNKIIFLLPDVSLMTGKSFIDDKSFKEKIFQNLFDNHLLRMIEENSEIDWIAKWSTFEKFRRCFKEGDEKINFHGRSLIYYALSNPQPKERYEISRFLLKRQCSIRHGNSSFDGPFHYLYRQKRHNLEQTIELSRMLILNGADINKPGDRNYLPLAVFFTIGVSEKELLPFMNFWFEQKELNLVLKTHEGYSLYDIAIKNGKKEIAELLRRYISSELSEKEEKAKLILVQTPEDKRVLVRIKNVFGLALSTQALLNKSKEVPVILEEHYLRNKAEKIIREERLEPFVQIEPSCD